MQVTGLGSDGLGLGEVDDRPFLVRNALPGEVVQARILKKRGGKRYGEAVSIEHRHKDRVEPACQYYPRCGGCSMQHIASSAQLELKERVVRGALEDLGVRASVWLKPAQLSRLGYRRKARLGVRFVGGEVLVGFRESFSNRVSRAEACEILTPALSRLMPKLKSTIAQTSGPDRYPQIELAQGDRELAILVRHLDPLSPEDMRLWQDLSSQIDGQVLLQSAGYDSLVAADGAPVRHLSYQIPDFGLAMDFHPAQFTQVNLAMNRELVRTALGLLGDIAGADVADLFCGIGNFSLPLARRGAQVQGHENAADAVAQARRNARKNALTERTRFEVTDLYAHENLPPIDADAILLDPPRSGAGEGLAQWAQAPRCRQVVYVSCNPATFAADAKTMINQGFRLDKVGIFDMFPHTTHVETVGSFRRG